MSDTKKELIKSLLNSSGKTAPDITHNISELGGGNMAAGLIILHRSGLMNGMAIGAGIMAAAYIVGNAVLGGVQAKRTSRQTCQKQMTPHAPNAAIVSDRAEAPLENGIDSAATAKLCV